MRRLALVALCGLLAGGGAGALARKAPPHRHAAKKHHRHSHHRRKPAKRPANNPARTPPAITTPATSTPASTTTTTAPATPAAPLPATTTTTTTTPPAPLGHALGVSASDAAGGGFVLSLSRTELGAGTELVEFRNLSQDGHDLRIDAADGTVQQTWDELASLADPVAKSVVLSPGTYRVYCTLHAGMEKQLTVAAG